MFKNVIFVFITSLIGYALSLDAYFSLEIAPQSFVLELKRIKIESHPHAFNPSIVRWKGSLLMSFWIVREPDLDVFASGGDSEVGLVWLDDGFNPIGDAYVLDFCSPTSRAQDLRLLNVGETLYMVYNDNQEEVVTEGGFRMWTAKLEFDADGFHIFHQQPLDYFDGACPTRREKNWVPFDYQGDLMLAYSLSPHLIFQPFDETACCQTVGITQSSIRWRWGELRGGTPAVRIDDQYLAFFHSCITFPSLESNDKNALHYFMGAYTFSKDPPFAITQCSTKPIIAKGFYSGMSYDYYWKPVCAIFPCGILVEDEFIWVSYGRQDHELWIAKIDRKELLESLKPVDQKELPGQWKSWITL